MSLQSVLTLALVTLAGALAVLVGITLAAHAVRGRTDRRRTAERAQLRAALLAMLATGATARVRRAGSRRGRRLLTDVTASLLAQLRGEDRAVLVRVLEGQGLVDEARLRTYRRGAVGRAQAALLLGTAAAHRALPELARLLRDRDDQVRQVAAHALGKLGDPAAAPFLLAALEGPRPLPAGLARTALLRLGPGATEQLRTGLTLPDPVARTVAAELLGVHAAMAAAPALAGVLTNDTEAPVRAAAARALGRIGVPTVVPAMLAALDDPDSTVRAEAATGLGAIGDARAVPALQGTLGHPDAATARGAAQGLLRCGREGIDALHEAVRGGGDPAAQALEALELVHEGAAR